jgi:hypothetical protein
MRACLAAVVVLIAAAVPAAGQGVSLSFDDGRVTIDARNTPVRAILAEWARLGGTTVVNGEKIGGAPLTISLVDMPEAQALEIILRNVAGYMAAPRRAANGASLYDRILVMPTSTAPAAASASGGRPAGPGNPAPGTQRFVRPGVPEVPAEEVVADEADIGVNPPVFSFPQPGQGQNIFQPVGQPNPFGTPIAPGAAPPAISLNPNVNEAGQAITVNPAPQQPGLPAFPYQPPGTGASFGVIGAPTPGVVQQPQLPGQPVRPPPRD